MNPTTPSEWKVILTWTKDKLGEALRSSGVSDGTTPEEQRLIETLERLATLHADAVACDAWRAKTGAPVIIDELTAAWRAGMEPDGRAPSPEMPYDALLAALIDDAQSNPVSFDALRHHGSNLLLDSTWPVPTLRRFLASVLRGELDAPVRPGRRPGIVARSVLIAAVTQDVVDRFDLPPMRNDATDAAQSACDAVAQAMRALRFSPASYDRIKQIWLARDWE